MFSTDNIANGVGEDIDSILGYGDWYDEVEQTTKIMTNAILTTISNKIWRIN